MAALQIGSARAVPGKITTGTLAVGHAPDAPIETRVHVAGGERDGPTLWLQGLVHGQEVGGPLAIGRFLKGLDLGSLHGNVVAIPVANPLAFRGVSRTIPVDGANLNRVFPGNPAGSHGEQLAAVLQESALGCADAIVDLHSGGDRSHVPFYALTWADGSAASLEAGRLARAAATPTIWESTDDWLRGSLFRHAIERGTPAVIVECGGGAAVPEAHIGNFVAALTGISQALGMLPGEPPTQPSYRVLGSCELLFSRTGGLFVASCGPGDVVAEGQEIGRLIDLMEETREVIRAPFGPAFLPSVRRDYSILHSGEMVCEIARITEGA